MQQDQKTIKKEVDNVFKGLGYSWWVYHDFLVVLRRFKIVKRTGALWPR